MPYKTGTAANFEELHDALVKFVAGYGTLGTPSYVGTGSGTLAELDSFPATVSETWTLTCTAAAANGGTFSVVGSVSGAQASATVGTLYTNGKLRFLIKDGATDFIVGDAFTIAATAGVMPTAERWQVLRYTGVTGISASSFLAQYEPWAAFKGPYHAHANGWATAVGQQNNSWLAWKMVQPFEFTRLTLRGSPTIGQSPRDFKLQYSEDGVTWVDRQAWTAITWTANQYREFTIDGASPGAKLYWRIFVTVNNGDANNTYIQEVIIPEFSFTADFDHSRRPAAWLKAPGLTGLDPCYINTQLYDRPTNDYYNLAFTGATGFIGASDFDNQPGARAALALPLWNQPITYWLSANGQRVILSVKVDTAYMSMYAGKIMTYGTPGQYPYPLLLAGALPTASGTRFSDAAVNMPFKGNRSNMVLRDAGGTWVAPFAWPYTKSSGTIYTFRDVAGAYCLLPVTLHTATNTYGVLDGVQFITGFNNAVENTVNIGAEVWTVLQDVTRNGIADFYAQRTS